MFPCESAATPSAALVPVATLAASGHDRYMFGGAYAVDHYALALKGFFLVATYVTILISVDYINEGDYYKGEFYVLLLTSAFGMSVMASARDLEASPPYSSRTARRMSSDRLAPVRADAESKAEISASSR